MKTVMSLITADQDRQVANVRMQLLLKDKQLAQVGEHAPSTEIIDSHGLIQAALRDAAQGIFMPFVRPGGELDKQDSGLELTIVKHAVQCLGGRIWADASGPTAKPIAAQLFILF